MPFQGGKISVAYTANWIDAFVGLTRVAMSVSFHPDGHVEEEGIDMDYIWTDTLAYLQNHGQHVQNLYIKGGSSGNPRFLLLRAGWVDKRGNPAIPPASPPVPLPPGDALETTVTRFYSIDVGFFSERGDLTHTEYLREQLARRGFRFPFGTSVEYHETVAMVAIVHYLSVMPEFDKVLRQLERSREESVLHVAGVRIGDGESPPKRSGDFWDEFSSLPSGTWRLVSYEIHPLHRAYASVTKRRLEPYGLEKLPVYPGEIMRVETEEDHILFLSPEFK